MASLRSFMRLPTFTSTRLLTQGAALYSTPPPEAPSKEKEESPEGKLKGRIHSKQSMKVNLVGGKRYLWCACGYSKNQPFCDGTHLWKRFRWNIKQHPVFFKAPKDMQASMCLCKQTNKPPYCDGTHRKKYVQEAVIEEPR